MKDIDTPDGEQVYLEHAYGIKTIVDCFMETPTDKSYCVRVVWNDHLDGEPPKLVTAHPLAP